MKRYHRRMDMPYITEVACRLIGATAVGAGVGLDRELRHKPAGLKTHALVGLGASLVTMVCAFLPDPSAMSRAIQGIVAGIGFLGGGAILKAANDESISGITTAASIWVVASLGIACGSGQWLMAIMAAAIALIVLVAGNAVEASFRKRR